VPLARRLYRAIGAKRIRSIDGFYASVAAKGYGRAFRRAENGDSFRGAEGLAVSFSGLPFLG
jgi:hypothetical protein